MEACLVHSFKDREMVLEQALLCMLQGWVVLETWLPTTEAHSEPRSIVLEDWLSPGFVLAGGSLEGYFLPFNPSFFSILRWLWWSCKTVLLCLQATVLWFHHLWQPWWSCKSALLHLWHVWCNFMTVSGCGCLGRLFFCAFWPSMTEACNLIAWKALKPSFFKALSFWRKWRSWKDWVFAVWKVFLCWGHTPSGTWSDLILLLGWRLVLLWPAPVLLLPLFLD